jgi:CDP-glucose 4,6-dehydratase
MKKSDFKMLKDLNGPVLITGHTGFKGTWMTLLLQHIGFSVIGYSLKPEKDSLYNLAKRNGKIEEVFGDIRDQEKLKKFIKRHKPSLIYHLAAQPLVIDSYSNPHKTFEVNSMGTANILDIALRIDSTKFIGVVTTDKVYENKEIGSRFKESDSLSGSDPYSESKVAAEAAVRTWQKISTLVNGPRIVSLRAGNVIGGGDLSKNRITADIVRAIKSDTELKIRNKNSTRPWQHALDVLFGYLLTAEISLVNSQIKTINFGPSNNSFTVDELVNIAKSKLTKLKVSYAENNQFDFHEAVNLQLDSTYAKEILEWEPFYSQSDSIISTFEWWEKYEEHHKSGENLCIDEIDYYVKNVRLPKYLKLR